MADQSPTGDPALGAELRAIRLAAKLSQTKLGERLGLKHTQISRIETGARSTTPAIVTQWYRECGYELESVQIGTPEQANSLALAAERIPKNQLDEVIEVALAWPGLTERVRGRILELIRS